MELLPVVDAYRGIRAGIEKPRMVRTPIVAISNADSKAAAEKKRACCESNTPELAHLGGREREELLT